MAFVNGTAAVGFGGRQYLDGAETYGGWMEFNHFGVFQGTDDDGRGFTDLWSIGAQLGENPGGTSLEWRGAFVGQEMLDDDNKGDRMRGSAMIEVVLGDPLAMEPIDTIDRARLTIGGDGATNDIVNIDNNNTMLPYGMYGLQTGVAAAPGVYTIPIEDGLFTQGSDTDYANVSAPESAVGSFTVEGSFYGDVQQEVGGIFSLTDDEDMPTYNLIGAFGADRRGN